MHALWISKLTVGAALAVALASGPGCGSSASNPDAAGGQGAGGGGGTTPAQVEDEVIDAYCHQASQCGRVEVVCSGDGDGPTSCSAYLETTNPNECALTIGQRIGTIFSASAAGVRLPKFIVPTAIEAAAGGLAPVEAAAPAVRGEIQGERSRRASDMAAQRSTGPQPGSWYPQAALASVRVAPHCSLWNVVPSSQVHWYGPEPVQLTA